MASPTPSMTTITPKTRPRRQSRFTEDSSLTGHEIAHQSPSDNALLLSFLLQQDEHEARKRNKARSDSNASNASTESFSSGRRNIGSSNGGSPVQGEFGLRDGNVHVGHRTIAFGNGNAEDGMGGRRSLDERPQLTAGVEVLAEKFKGRLRALTGGKDRNKASPSPYTGT